MQGQSSQKGDLQLTPSPNLRSGPLRFPLPRETIRDWRTASYALLLALVAAGVVIVSKGLGQTHWSSDGVSIGGLCLVAAVMERTRVRVGGRHEESVSLLVILFAAVLFGPLVGAIVGAASFLADLRRPLLKWVVYTSTRSITGASAGAIAYAASSVIARHILAIVVGSIAATLGAEIVDRGFAITTGILRGAFTGARSVLLESGQIIFASAPFYFSVVVVLVTAYQQLSSWTLPLFVVPVIAMQRLVTLYRDQVNLSNDLRAANQRQQESSLSFAAALIASLDARDRYTAGHSSAVAIYARDIACELELSDEIRKETYEAGLIHDIGKIALPLGILEKPGPLTHSERETMEGHALAGYEMICKIAEFQSVALAVKHHHERIDGMGYPDQLQGDDIPFVARILAVADSYDAMISDRPYRDGMPTWVAQARLIEGSGTQFEPAIVDAFLRVLSRAEESYQTATGSAFVARRAAQLRAVS